MSLGSPDMPEAPNPAKRPERRSTVKPENVVTSGSDQEDDNSSATGRRALRRPAGGTSAGSSSGVGTGLNA